MNAHVAKMKRSLVCIHLRNSLWVGLMVNEGYGNNEGLRENEFKQ